MATYNAEAAHLLKSYHQAVGFSLQYGLQVHDKGRMKCLGDLRDQNRKHERENGLPLAS